MSNAARLVGIALILVCSSVAGVVAVTAPDAEPSAPAPAKCTTVLAPGASC